MKGVVSGSKNENLLFLQFCKITCILMGLTRGSCLIPAWSHMKFILPIVPKEVINDESGSPHAGSLFLMTLTYFSEKGLGGGSVIQNAWKTEQLNLIIATQRTLQRETFVTRKSS